MIRHLGELARRGQLRFRAETFGLYFPAAPDRRPFWRVSPTIIALLARQGRGYSLWRRRMIWLSRGGAHEWWGREWPAIDLEGEYIRSSGEPSS